MAKKKARTPMPPRTVQAPQRRESTKQGNPLSEVPTWVWIVSAVVLIGGIAIIFFVANSSSSGKPTPAAVKTAMLAANCTYRDVKPLPPRKDPTGANGGYHADVPTLTTPTKGLWSTDPPSGGAHYPEWAIWGFYNSPVNPRQVVHNEEHGGVIMWYGPKVPKSTVDKLEAFYNQAPDGMFGTPYAPLGDKIALTAWTGDPARYYQNGYYGMGHIAVCGDFNQKAFSTFRDAYVGGGPEGIPLKPYDEPGQGPQSS